MAKAECRCEELCPRVGFIVTNLATDSRAVVRFYNRLGVIAYNLGNLWRRLALPKADRHLVA